MELRSLSIIKIYIIFQDLYIAVHIHVLKKDYAIITKYSKKKKNDKKYKYNIIREVYLKPKDLKKRKWQPKEMNVFL